MNVQRLKCLFGFHPPDAVVTRTVGNADEYGHKHCTACGRNFGHWDHT